MNITGKFLLLFMEIPDGEAKLGCFPEREARNLDLVKNWS